MSLSIKDFKAELNKYACDFERYRLTVERAFGHNLAAPLRALVLKYIIDPQAPLMLGALRYNFSFYAHFFDYSYYIRRYNNTIIARPQFNDEALAMEMLIHFLICGINRHECIPKPFAWTLVVQPPKRLEDEPQVAALVETPGRRTSRDFRSPH